MCVVGQHGAAVLSPNAGAYSPAGSTQGHSRRGRGRLPPHRGRQAVSGAGEALHRSAGEPRDRRRPLKVVVSGAERAEIEGRARATGLSTSAYLRSVGLGHEPRRVYDLDAVADLAQMNGDLGRLADRLTRCLNDGAGQGGGAVDVARLVGETRELQRRMLALMGRV